MVISHMDYYVVSELTTQINTAKNAAGTLAVIYTGWKATRTALRTARLCAHEYQVRLLVPIPVPYAAPLSIPPADTGVLAERLAHLAFETALAVRIEFLVCRNIREALLQALAPHSLVLIARSRWRIGELALARQLRRAGHSVLVIDSKGAPERGERQRFWLGHLPSFGRHARTPAVNRE